MAGRRAPPRAATALAQMPKVSDAKTQRALDVLHQAILELQSRRHLGLFSATADGYVPAAGDDETLFLRADGVWAAAAGGSGEVNTASNVGAGAAVWKDKVGVDLRFRSIIGVGITVTENANDITLTAAAAGETNTASSVGAGSSVWKDKVGVDLRFRSIIGAGVVTVTENANDITITSSGEANTASNVGAGAGVWKDKSGVDLRFRSIIGTGAVTVTENANDVTVDVPAAADLTGIGLGFFGSGIDGDATMDGSTVVAGMTPALNGSNTKNFVINANYNYNRVRDYHFNNLTIDADVITNGPFRVFVKGTLTLNGTISNLGINGGGGTTAAGGAGGPSGGSGTLPGRAAGGNGDTTTIGQNGGARTNCPRDFTNAGGTANVGANGTAGVSGRGGAGGAMVGTSAAAGGTIGNMTANNGSLDNIMQAMDGTAIGTGGNVQFIPGSGGGAGAGQGGNHGGSGGGSGGGALVVCAREIVGTGFLDVTGGNGGTIISGNGGGGGGGGGGWVTVVIGTGSFPTVDVSGGNGGIGTNAGFDGGAGGVGVAKLYRIGA